MLLQNWAESRASSRKVLYTAARGIGRRTAKTAQRQALLPNATKTILKLLWISMKKQSLIDFHSKMENKQLV